MSNDNGDVYIPYTPIRLKYKHFYICFKSNHFKYDLLYAKKIVISIISNDHHYIFLIKIIFTVNIYVNNPFCKFDKKLRAIRLRTQPKNIYIFGMESIAYVFTNNGTTKDQTIS